ncbi:MAG: right-handed parallel beta-helix repeat-containing protein [Planctomycetota bacterium]
MKQLKTVTAVMAVCMMGISAASAATKYVKATPTGAANCSSWANACYLATALAQATSGDQVWAAAGVYGPLSLVGGVKVYGGFAGTETLASQSDPDLNVTTIDGAGVRAVTSSGNNSSTVLRGFTIQNGHDSSFDGGGGLSAVNSDARFVRCTFQNNSAAWWGGAASLRGTGSPQFINCIFRNNGENSQVATLGAGAIWLDGPSPTFTNCLFHGNKAGEGGVIAVRIGSPIFAHCTMTGNQGTVGIGGAIHDIEGHAVIRNSILWNDLAAQGGNEIANGAIAVSTVAYTDLMGGFTGTGNINADPLFVSPATANYSIQSTSPCINVGQNSALPADVGDLDWDGNLTELLPTALNLLARKLQFVVDMGANEIVSGGGSGGLQY